MQVSKKQEQIILMIDSMLGDELGEVDYCSLESIDRIGQIVLSSIDRVFECTV